MDKSKLEIYFSPEELLQLDYYIDILLRWNQKINLTSRKNSREKLYYFALEAFAMTKLIQDTNSLIVDFGAGGGFPGIILAILGYNNLYLVEIITKKANFLNFVTAELNLQAKIQNQNIQDFYQKEVDYLVSKAVSEPQIILEATKHLKPNKIIIPSKEGYEVNLQEEKFFFKLL